MAPPAVDNYCTSGTSSREKRETLKMEDLDQVVDHSVDAGNSEFRTAGLQKFNLKGYTMSTGTSLKCFQQQLQ